MNPLIGHTDVSRGRERPYIEHPRFHNPRRGPPPSWKKRPRLPDILNLVSAFSPSINSTCQKIPVYCILCPNTSIHLIRCDSLHPPRYVPLVQGRFLTGSCSSSQSEYPVHETSDHSPVVQGRLLLLVLHNQLPQVRSIGL